MRSAILNEKSGIKRNSSMVDIKYVKPFEKEIIALLIWLSFLVNSGLFLLKLTTSDLLKIGLIAYRLFHTGPQKRTLIPQQQ